MVTYTKAATAELRDRLRRRLAELARVMDGEAVGDDFLAALAARLAAHFGREAKALIPVAGVPMLARVLRALADTPQVCASGSRVASASASLLD